MSCCRLTGCILALICVVTSASQAEVVSSRNDLQEMALTIYGDDLAVVRERRASKLPGGAHTITLQDVSGKLIPETVLLSGMGIRVLEQSFSNETLSRSSLLNKYVGKDVLVVKTHPTTGEEEVIKARLLSVDEGIVLKIDDHLETEVPGRLVFPDPPEGIGLEPSPRLQVKVEQSGVGRGWMNLRYLTAGLSWQADYVAELTTEDRLDLHGWFTLINESGIDYPTASIQVVAGGVHRVPQMAKGPAVMRMAADAVMAEGMQEEELSDNHLYTLDRPVSLLDKQRKQVTLLQAEQVRCRKEYVLAGSPASYRAAIPEVTTRTPVSVLLELENSEAAHLGKPLPAGVLRVFSRDHAGTLQFIGEDRIEHVPVNGIVQAKLGDAFDVTAEHRQTDFKKVSGFSGYNYVFETGHEITLSNARLESLDVRVEEPMPGDWEVLMESHPHEQTSARVATWHLTVPPKAEVALRYRIRVRF